MGWWKINGCGGGIDFDSAPAFAGSSLINAIPGQSTPENHYNGDQPADIIGVALDDMGLDDRSEKGLPLPDEGTLEKFLLRPLDERVPEPLNVSTAENYRLVRIAKRMLKDLDRCWQKTWHRRPYKEERQAAIRFAMGHIYFNERMRGKNS